MQRLVKIDHRSQSVSTDSYTGDQISEDRKLNNNNIFFSLWAWPICECIFRPSTTATIQTAVHQREITEVLLE